MIFVHGLDGGSVSTGTYGKDFWPRDWLPQDRAFHDVRIHTFGYSTGLGSQSILQVTDSADLLLKALSMTIPISLRGQRQSGPNDF